jgi:TetR/AcrR family transcriptional repressor of nem operon
MASKVREKIVDAAVDRFHALGFSACSVQDIVDKAGLPKGTFYNYFKAKELLALEVLEVYGKNCERETLSDKTLAPLDRIRNHFEFMAARFARSGYDKGCLICNFAAETSDTMPLIREALDQSLNALSELIEVAIREAQSEGSVTTDLDAGMVARFLTNSWEGAVIRMKVVNSREPLDDFFSIAFSLLTRPNPNSRAPRKPAAKVSAKRTEGSRTK